MLAVAHWRDYVRLTRLDRPIGIWLVLWPTLWALWFAAEGVPPLPILLVFIGGTVLMRSAGCAINDYADRHIDGHVRRTAQRPLATGAIQPREALLLFALLSLISFGLVLLLNTLTILLSFGALLLAALYPFMKRHTHLPQAFLGAAFGWAVPMAFAAVSGSVPPVAWLLFMATLCWALAYDTLYAMADREDDLKIGVKSTAILLGRFDLLGVALCQLLVVLLLAAVGWQLQRGTWFWTGLVIATLLFLWLLWRTRSRQPAAAFQAFLDSHYFGVVVLIGLMLDSVN